MDTSGSLLALIHLKALIAINKITPIPFFVIVNITLA